MKKTNPSKAQLRRHNERLQRAAKRANDAKVDAWTQVRAAQRQRDLALQILSEISPDMAALLTRPDLLPLDQRGLEMVRMPPRFDAARMLRTIEARAYEPNRLIEHWLTRMRMEVEYNHELQCHVLCFRMRRPRGKDSLAWQWAFDDVVAERCPSAVRYMVMHAAERLASELEAKIGGRRG